MEVREYKASNWFTRSGIARKIREIEAKGMPDMTGGDWKMITLTIDPEYVDGPLEGYFLGKDRMRRFLFGLRAMVGDKFAWAWKLEFQRNEMPHWHIMVNIPRKFTVEELKYLNDVIWGLGRTNVKRIYDANYLFKYAFKSPVAGNHPLPDWVLDYITEEDSQGDQQSFERLRIWQTSKGFYTGQPKEVKKADQADEEKKATVVRTLREALDERARKLVIVARHWDRTYIKGKVVTMKRRAGLVWQELCNEIITDNAVHVDDGLEVKTALLTNQIELKWLPQLAKLSRLHRIKVRGILSRRRGFSYSAS